MEDKYSMIEDRAILGLHIDTQYGSLKPLSIDQYLLRLNSLSVLSMSKKYLLSELGKQEQKLNGQKDSEIFAMLKELNERSLKSLLQEYFEEIFHHYIIITRLCKYYELDELRNEFESQEELDKALLLKSYEFLDELSDEEFDDYRKILLSLHAQSELSAKLNPALQRREDKAKEFKARKAKENGNAPTLTTMISACSVYMGLDYSTIAKWNVLQLQHSFQRVALFIANSDTTLFRTVTDEVEHINWSENISTDIKEDNDMTLEQFTKTMENRLG